MAKTGYEISIAFNASFYHNFKHIRRQIVSSFMFFFFFVQNIQ